MRDAVCSLSLMRLLMLKLPLCEQIGLTACTVLGRRRCSQVFAELNAFCGDVRPCPDPSRPSLVGCAGGAPQREASLLVAFIVVWWLGLAPLDVSQSRSFLVTLSLSGSLHVRSQIFGGEFHM